VAAPRRTLVTLTKGTLHRVTLLIPPGHSGLTTFAMEIEGTRVIPFAVSETIVGDDEVIPFDLDYDFGMGRVLLVTTNADTYDHTFFVRYEIETARSGQAVPQGPSLVIVPPLEPVEDGGDHLDDEDLGPDVGEFEEEAV